MQDISLRDLIAVVFEGMFQTPYAFIRSDGFYVLELKDDADAKSNAAINPGTVKVENLVTGKVVWGTDEQEDPK